MTRVKFRTFAVIAALIAALLIVTNDGLPTTAASGGLVNPGFESGTLDGNPVDWTVVHPVADVVRVVDTEGPAEFPTYADMGNITVSPYKGNLMLRTGTPQRLAQNQTKGNNLVQQTFSSTSSTLDFAFRVFSWEHRGQDFVKFDIKDLSVPTPTNQEPPSVGDLAESIQILDANGKPMAMCHDIPCQFSLNAGDQGQFLDSDWRVVNVTGLPIGHTLRLSYQVTGTKDASHATWAYWDNFNTPPVAKFSFLPAHPNEGDIVQFTDLSYDPDPGDSIVSRTWVIDGQTFSVASPYFVFDDEANFVVSITVEDTFGAVTVALDNTTALDGEAIPDLVVGNANPLVNALNMEVLAGDELTLRGRFLDTGYLDHHNANWSINGNPPATVEEENDPLLSTGLVTGSITPTGNLSGNLTVNDEDGGSGSDPSPFNVTVVPDTAASRMRHEPNNVANGAPILESDNAIVSFIQQDGDVDVYEVRMPGGGHLKAGSEMLVSLTNLHADVDVAILSKLPAQADTQWGRFQWGRFGSNEFAFGESDSTVLQWGRFQWGRFQWGRFQWGRFGDLKIGMDTFNTSGATWSDIQWGRFGGSQPGFEAPGNLVESIDVDLAELGLGNIGGDDIQVADFSANRGLDDETAWARAATPGSSFYVAVFTSDGEQSLTPYTLSAEVIEQPDLQIDLGTLCDGSPLVPIAAPEQILYNYDDPSTPGDHDETSVLVTQWERLINTYGLDSAAQADLLNDLTLLAQHPKVKADIYSVPSDIFDLADQEKCNVDATNSVTTQIRTRLKDNNYENAANYVLVGNDDIIPFRRALDYTIIGNEKNYLLDSFLEAGSKSFAAVLQGYMLTDDYYGDATGAPWQGDQAWVPTKGIGRLVETPLEIRAQAQAAVASNLTLNPATGSVFGYDFFKDGTTAIGDSLDAGLLGPVQREISDSWTADDMSCVLLGTGVDPKCGVRDLASPNGHSTHYGILSANGFNANDFTDFLSSTDVATTGGGAPVLKNTLVFTMGCHAGFNSPDASSGSADPGLGVDPALDLAQAMARQGALYIASTGFGLGDDTGIGGHERLMELLPQALLKGGVTVGEAMSAAKQAYLGGLVSMTVYDMKVSMETTLYGLPQYEVDPAEGTSLLAVPIVENLGVTEPNFSLTTTDAGSLAPTVTSNHLVEPVSGPKGTYYTLDGDAQGGPGRTLQPSFAEDISGDADSRHPYAGAPPPLHGVRITGGTYTDIANDPVFSRPKFEWEIIDPAKKLEKCQAGYSPASPAEINSFQRGQNLTQTLVGVAGQFRCTDTVDGVVLGIERLYSSLNLELRRCTGDNTDGPTLNGIELRDGVVPGTVDVRIDASDMEASDSVGLTRVEVLRVDEGSIFPVAATLTQVLPAEGAFRGIYNASVDSVEQTTDMLVQVEDTDCNVTLDTFKSAGINFIKVDAGPDQLMPADRTVTLTGTIENFDDLVPPAWFDWEFGDGTFLDGVLPPADKATVDVTVDAFGTATFSVQHTYAAGLPTPITATLEVHDSAGGNGSDETHIVCDPIGDAEGPDGDWVGCASSNSNPALPGATMTISVAVDGAITNQFQYRVYIDAGKYNTKKKVWDNRPDGIFDAQLKYNGGQVTGLASLTATVDPEDPNVLHFTFNLSEFGLIPDEAIGWYAETQAGTPGTPATGKIDRMPDAGWLSHTIQ